ncbi:MAG: Enoyl-CoA hydratase [Acidimicrobiales bacterium]|nr:Enoyl-CoA hydratase [Acidimicrobiales bacterium]
MTDGDFTCLRFERLDGDVLHVTIDRPGDDLNRVDEALHHDLAALFPRLQREREARAVLLSGHGRAFSAGGDFAWFPSLQADDRLERLRLDAKAMIWSLLDVHLPIVCALAGPAVGLGASIALLCDVVVMAESATIADPHVRVGIVAGDGGTVAWPLAIGPMLAKRYLLTGDPVTATDAARMGLVTEVAPDAELPDRALAWARRLAAGAPLAVQHTKQAVNQLVKDAAGRSFDLATALEIATFRSADHAEALAAIREKRPPEFEGR